MTGLSTLLQQLYAIAESAAELVLAVYDSDFGVELKGPNDPVTEADKRANQLICERLADAFPGCPIVAEESDPCVFGDYQHAGRVFFVDPVDGTREFVRRTGEFVVMIGCVEETRATAGVIWAPTLDTVWLGESGAGAFRRRGSEGFLSIGPALAPDPSDALMLVSRAQTQQEIVTLQQQLHASRVTAMGSAGLKGASIADGSADAYVAPRYAGKRWDACAPDAIVSAAGAVFTDCHGQGIDYRSQDLVNRRGLLAANAGLHQRLIERLRLG